MSTPGPGLRATLLRRLHVGGPSTRAMLASELGLGRSRIKSVVDGLAESGLVTEAVPTRREGVGRPSLLVVPASSAVAVLAIDVRVDQVAIAMVGIGGQILGRHSWKLHRTTRLPGEVITHVAESAQLLRDELGVRERGVGVSVPGVIQHADGLVREAPNLGWRDVALGARLAAVLDAPTVVWNDGVLGALAEHVRGAARDASDLVFVSADVGIGGGVILDGKAVRGNGGFVGELGHMIVRPGGRACFCGQQGCWETEVGEAALCRALGLPEDGPRGVLVAELRQLEQHPDRVSLLDDVCEWLVTGLVTAVNMLAPELVVLGDLFAELPQSLVDRVKQEISNRSLVSRAAGGTRVVVSPLGQDGKLLGAAELAFEPVLAGL